MPTTHEDSAGHLSTPHTSALVTIAAIALITATLALWRLGAADLCGGNEAVEGVFVQRMVEHGEWLFPLENGREPMYKPPLFHWTATVLSHGLGLRKVTAFGLRLPSALYAVAGVIVTMVFALSVLGPQGSFLAGLSLAASYQYISQARVGRVDMALTFFEALALFSAAWMVQRRPQDDAGRDAAMRYVFAAALGLAVLAKGPVGAILPLGAVAIFLFVNGRAQRPRALFSPGSAILAIVLGSAWYITCLVAARYGFLDRQLGSENLGRFFGGLGKMAPWYYAWPLILNSGALSLLVPFAVWAALRADHGDQGGQRSDPAIAAMKLLAIFWVVTVVFFMIAAYKRRTYLLPLWPPAAVLLAWWIRSLASRRWGGVLRAAFVAACAAMIVVNLVFIPRREVRDCLGESFREAAEQIARAVGHDEPLYMYGFQGEPAPLLFYLGRDVPVLAGRLSDAPPGYVILPANLWASLKGEALDLEPVLAAGSGHGALVLLHHGRVYAILD